MWSSGGEETTITQAFSGASSSSTPSSSSSSAPSPFLPSSKTMEEIWKDINLSSLGRPSADINPRGAPYGGLNMNLQDFLARPFSTREPPDRGVLPTCYGNPAQPPPTALTLNSSQDFNFLSNADQFRQNQVLLQPPSPVLRHEGCAAVPFDGIDRGSGSLVKGKKRFPEQENNTGDRRHKRMIKNRESAARSRARKQAYTNELELEVAHLMEENASLKKQQQQLCVAASGQLPKKNHLYRTSTAPF